MKTITVANHKGGCGKTTTAISIGAALAEQGYRVLLVDLDPQAHATLGLGIRPDNRIKSIYEVLVHPKISVPAVVLNTRTTRMDLIPSNMLLSGAEIDLNRMLGKEWILNEKLRQVGNAYDFCIVDCAPYAGLLTLNALIASTGVLIPVQVHYYALQGLHYLLETIGIVNKRYSPCIVETLGLLLTFVDERTHLTERIRHAVRGYFSHLVFQTEIHNTISLAEAPGSGMPIQSYAPQSRGAKEYYALSREILQRLLTQRRYANHINSYYRYKRRRYRVSSGV